jgi:cation diffusion facilitator family transporter
MSTPTDVLRSRGTRRVLYVVLFLNLAVCLAKLVAGALAHSLAVISDGVHSSIDAVNNVVGLVLLRLAAQEPDAGHPYGHGKIETLGAFSIAGFMFITCYEIAKRAIGRLWSGSAPPFDITALTFLTMAVTLVVNIFVVAYERRAAGRYGSEFLYADALHTLSDVFVTLSVLMGLPLVLNGFLYLDALLALGISAVIAWSGYRVLQRTVPVLLDAASVDASVIERLALALPRVVAVKDIRSRLHGGRKFVELTLVVSESDLVQAHELTERLEEKIIDKYGRAAITIHVEPSHALIR